LCRTLEIVHAEGLAAHYIYHQQKLKAAFIQSLQLFGHMYIIYLIGILCLWDYSEESCTSHFNAVVQLMYFRVLILGRVAEHFIGSLVCVMSVSHCTDIAGFKCCVSTVLHAVFALEYHTMYPKCAQAIDRL